jgi:simple sugar transport system permease protein
MESTDAGLFLFSLLAGAIRCGTPIAFAALGETLSEKAGILNLGIEGLMLVGAMVAVAVQVETGNLWLAVIAAGLASAALASIHAYVAVGLGGNQVVSGIALSLLGTGLSGFFGRPYVGVRFDGIGTWSPSLISDLPVVGRLFASQDPLVYVCLVAAVGISLLLSRSRYGLYVRAAGEDPQSAFAQGVPVHRVRVIAVLVGGFFAGLGGAHLSLAYTHLWAERMTAGQGWIAAGLVIVARWRPAAVLAAAYLFGGLTVLHPRLQAAGVSFSPYLVSMFPYLGAILALVLATVASRGRGPILPAALARSFRGAWS